MTRANDPKEHRLRVNGIELAYFEWGRELRGQQPSILLAHATGFHARVWDQVIAHLDDRHVISLDQRGHGRSENAPIHEWRVMGADLTEFSRKLGLREAIGVGHSMGGHALTLAAASWPDAFSRLVLIDPVIMSPDLYSMAQAATQSAEPSLNPAAKRKNHFASPDEMFERFANRPPYSFFEPDALRDYCEYGLVPAPDGSGYVLACPPEVEAAMYETGASNPGVYESVREIRCPVLILRAKEPSSESSFADLSVSPTWPELANEFQHARDVELSDLTHFMPMESPKLIADYILSG